MVCVFVVLWFCVCECVRVLVKCDISQQVYFRCHFVRLQNELPAREHGTAVPEPAGPVHSARGGQPAVGRGEPGDVPVGAGVEGEGDLQPVLRAGEGGSEQEGGWGRGGGEV